MRRKKKDILEIAREKLEELGLPPNPLLPALPHLMLAVFNEETPDNFDLNMYDRQDMENEISAMLQYSDKAVLRMLGLHDQDKYDQVREQLEKANTVEEIRYLLVGEVLYEAMSENLDDFPNKLWINPIEPFVQREAEARRIESLRTYTQNGQNTPPKEKEKKREHHELKHREEINAHFRKLRQEAEAHRAEKVQKKKRPHHLDKHQEEINAHFDKLHKEAEARRAEKEQKKKRVHHLEKHLEEMEAHFRKLREEAEAKRKKPGESDNQDK